LLFVSGDGLCGEVDEQHLMQCHVVVHILFKFNFKLGLLYCLLFLLGIVLEHASERELACVELVDGILRICN
jgi:hypothetical protein